MNKINKWYYFEYEFELSKFIYFFKFELYSKNEIRSERPIDNSKHHICFCPVTSHMNHNYNDRRQVEINRNFPLS